MPALVEGLASGCTDHPLTSGIPYGILWARLETAAHLAKQSMQGFKFQVHKANHYRPTLIQSDVELLLKVLDFYAEQHPHPRRAIEMASNIRNHWRPAD